MSLAQRSCAKHTAANRSPRIPLSQTPYSWTVAITLKNEGVRDRVWIHVREQRSGVLVSGASTCWDTVMNAVLNDSLWSVSLRCQQHIIVHQHRVIILNRGSMFAFQSREFSPPLSSAHRLLQCYHSQWEIGDAAIPVQPPATIYIFICVCINWQQVFV